MRQMLFTLTALFILLTSTVSWGSPDKKGIICECVNCSKIINKKELGFWFENERAYSRKFTLMEEKIVTSISKIGAKVRKDPSYLLWFTGNGHSKRLNRETLTLETFHFEALRSKRKCEIYNSSGFMRKWEELKNHHQMSVNKQLKKNKI